MTDLSSEDLDGLKQTYEGTLADANKKGQTYALVKDVEKVVRALGELTRRRDGENAKTRPAATNYYDVPTGGLIPR